MQEEVITSFGRMKTSVWRLIEAVIQAGPAQRNTCDLVMLLNTRFSSEEDFKKFSGFVIGLLKYVLLFSHSTWNLKYYSILILAVCHLFTSGSQN